MYEKIDISPTLNETKIMSLEYDNYVEKEDGNIDSIQDRTAEIENIDSVSEIVFNKDRIDFNFVTDRILRTQFTIYNQALNILNEECIVDNYEYTIELKKEIKNRDDKIKCSIYYQAEIIALLMQYIKIQIPTLLDNRMRSHSSYNFSDEEILSTTAMRILDLVNSSLQYRNIMQSMNIPIDNISTEALNIYILTIRLYNEFDRFAEELQMNAPQNNDSREYMKRNILHAKYAENIRNLALGLQVHIREDLNLTNLNIQRTEKQSRIRYKRDMSNMHDSSYKSRLDEYRINLNKSITHLKSILKSDIDKQIRNRKLDCNLSSYIQRSYHPYTGNIFKRIISFLSYPFRMLKLIISYYREKNNLEHRIYKLYYIRSILGIDA